MSIYMNYFAGNSYAHHKNELLKILSEIPTLQVHTILDQNEIKE